MSARGVGLFSNIGHLVRLAHAGFILAREGVFKDVDPEIVPPAARPMLALSRRLARSGTRQGRDALAIAMARLGPSYVKLGQFLATRPDVVGMSAARALEALQDRMAPFPQATARRIVEMALGQPVEAIYSSFGEPVAAASIAQVHRASVETPDGPRDVAVKVARPGVDRRFARDLADMFFAARLAERHSPEAQRLRMVEVVETLARSVRLEMDFRLEAAAASEFAENVARDPDFRVPQVDWDRTARTVLTLEWMDGIPLSDTPAIIAAGIDPVGLGRIVIQSFLRHAMRDGFFHADMHPGNLFVDPQGQLIAVDFGIMGRLGPAERRFLAEILFGFITKDYHRVAMVHFEAGYVPREHSVDSFAQAIRAIGEPIHSRSADQISMARLLTLLFEITALFDMRTRPELVLLQKTMVVVEGVARNLDPQLNMWATAEPVVRSWIEDHLGPVGRLRDAGTGLGEAVQALTRAPALLARTEIVLGQLEDVVAKGIDIAPDAVLQMQRAQSRASRAGHWALWVLVAAAIYALVR